MIPVILLKLLEMNLLNKALVHVSQSLIGRLGGGCELIDKIIMSDINIQTNYNEISIAIHDIVGV